MTDAIVILGVLYFGWMLFIMLQVAYKESTKGILALTLSISGIISSVFLIGSGILDHLIFLGDIILYPNIFIHWFIYSTIVKRGTSETPIQRFARYRLRKKVDRIYEKYSLFTLFLDELIGEAVWHAKADRLSPSDVAFQAITLSLEKITDKECVSFQFISDNNFKELDKIINACQNERDDGRLNIQIYNQCIDRVSQFKDKFNI